MKNKGCLIAILFCVGVSQTCFANSGRGVYLGIDVGYSSANYHTIHPNVAFTPNSIRDTGISPKLSLGLDFNRYVGVEVNAIYFQRPLFEGVGLHSVALKVKQNLVYFALKLSAPLFRGFALYGKIGYGYIVRGDITFYNRDGQFLTPLVAGEFSETFYSLGVNYEVARHWILGLTWVNAPPKASVQLPASNYFGLGAAYKFYF